MTATNLDWNRLSEIHPRELVDALRNFFEKSGPFELTAEELVSETEFAAEEARALLCDAVSAGALQVRAAYLCRECDADLSEDEARGEQCPYCKRGFEEGIGVATDEAFVCDRAPTRDVRWVLTLHGMNTLGGRVILLGCILRPDFPWGELIDRGQVEAVLNNYGTKDFWALISHYFIPYSGPSGRRGFNDQLQIINIPATDYGHTDFFRSDNLISRFHSEWGGFLTMAKQDLSPQEAKVTKNDAWKQAAWNLRATMSRFLLLLFGSILVVFAIISFLVGVAICARYIAGLHL